MQTITIDGMHLSLKPFIGHQCQGAHFQVLFPNEETCIWATMFLMYLQHQKNLTLTEQQALENALAKLDGHSKLEIVEQTWDLDICLVWILAHYDIDFLNKLKKEMPILPRPIMHTVFFNS